MSFNISAWSIRQPVPSVLLFVVLLALGWVSFMNLPITKFPNIDVPVISVTVTQSASTSVLPTKIGPSATGDGSGTGGGSGGGSGGTGVAGTSFGTLPQTGLPFGAGPTAALSLLFVVVGAALMVLPRQLVVEKARRH